MAVGGLKCLSVAPTVAVGLWHARNIRETASSGQPKYCELATYVRDPGHCARPAGNPRSNTVPDYGSSRPVVHNTPAGRTTNLKKNFCCVTTRRRNLLSLRRLWRSLGSLTASLLCCGVLGFDLGVLTAAALSLRRLPTANFAQAVRILAVALIPTPRHILTPAPFAQAEPQAGSPRLGRPLSGTTAVFEIIVEGAHGSYFSQGIAWGECANVLLGRLSKREPDQTVLCQSNPRSGNKTRKKTEKETVLKSPSGRKHGRI